MSYVDSATKAGAGDSLLGSYARGGSVVSEVKLGAMVADMVCTRRFQRRRREDPSYNRVLVLAMYVLVDRGVLKIVVWRNTPRKFYDIAHPPLLPSLGRGTWCQTMQILLPAFP